MATQPKIAPEQADVVMMLSPDDVAVGERLGVFWPDKAAALGRLMAEDGQDTPIKVRRCGPRAAKPWELVQGLHRLEGAKLERLPIVLAVQATGDEVELRRLEASENIERGKRGPLERANFVRAIADAAERRMQSQHEGLSQQEIAVRARWAALKAKAAGVVRAEELDEAEADHTRVNFTRVYGWREEVAAAIGMSAESVKKDLSLHRALITPFPGLWRDLATHPVIGDNAAALREIAAIRDEQVRRELIALIIAHPDMTLAQAKAQAGLADPAAAPATGATKYMNGTVSNLGRLSAEQQRSIAANIAETIKPTALAALRDALNARIDAISQGEKA